jgi:hypothetical protein
MSDKKIYLDNLYKILPRVCNDEIRKYERFNLVNIKIPLRMMIVGPSGSGKALFEYILLKNMQCFNRFYIFADCCQDESIYKFMIDKLKILEKRWGFKIVFYSKNPLDIEELSFDPRFNNLVIFDDQMCKNLKTRGCMTQFLIKSRHHQCSVLMMAQSMFKIDRTIRLNITQLVLKKINNLLDIKNTLSQYFENDKENENSLFKKIGRYMEGFSKFFSKNKINSMLFNFDPIDENHSICINFSPISELISIDDNEEKNIDKLFE